MKRFLPLLAVLPLLSTPAAAGPFDVCLLGCESGPAGSLLAEQQLNPVLRLRPSVDLQVAVRDGLDHAWTMGLAPGIGYGIGWRPPGWRVTPELLGLDLHASAVLREGTLYGRGLMMLTLGGVLTLGAGVDMALASGAGGDRFGLAVAVGARYAP